jgi:phospholipid/cholesterol/gamma-HCH transport system substrate-binding protein
MKDDKRIANAKLGMIVIASLIFLVFSLYMIGKNQNIFGRSFSITAVVKNVNGLVPGNNVRFQGMDVGTVKSVEMLDDTTIHVTLLIHKSMQSFIKKNALTAINTDGLMGNKIIQILPQEEFAQSVEEGDVLYPAEQIDTDEMLAKLNASGDYLELTLINLAEITEKLNESEAIWEVLSDPNLSADLKGAVREFRLAGANASAMAKAGKDLVTNLEQGDGLVTNLFTDTLMNGNFEKSLEQLEQTSGDAAEMMVSMKTLIQNIQKGEGTAGLILSDSAFREQMVQTLENIESTTYKLNENMEAMKSNFLFRKYYKDQEKAQKKAEKSQN